MSQGILSNTKVYLCGQVENVDDPTSWRKRLARGIPQIISGLTIWDPLIRPNWVDPDICGQIAFDWKQKIFGNQEEGRKHWEANLLVRRLCKQLANKCDWMIAHISKTFTWGSIDELEIAISRRIPIFFILPDGPISVYGLAGATYAYEMVPYMVHRTEPSLLQSLSEIHRNRAIVERDPETWMYIMWTNAGELECAKSKLM